MTSKNLMTGSARRTSIISVSLLLVCVHHAMGLVVPVEIAVQSSVANLPASSSPIEGTFLLSLLDSKQQNLAFSTKGFQRDQVARILDANTIKLQKNGIVTIAGTRMPTPGSSTFQFPTCFDKGPTYKLRQLVPANTEVLVKVVNKNSGGMQAVIIRNEDYLFLNQELVRTGFGRAQKVSDPILKEYIDFDKLRVIQDDAQSKGLGIFQQCDVDGGTGEAKFEAQFEPLELTIETQWKDDGGKQILKQREYSNGPPENPGDRKGCSDFNTYEDALRWFEYYKPFYGDVAKLDRDGDGVPCPGLPHTQNQGQYRMKVPSSSGGF